MEDHPFGGSHEGMLRGYWCFQPCVKVVEGA